jgi:Ftsk gamma domain
MTPPVTDAELAQMAKFVVSTTDFRRLLKTVLPHAHTKPDIPALNRVRLILDGSKLTVVATCAFTVALACASVGNEYGDDALTFDLSPDDVKRILSFHTETSEVDGQQQLTVAVDDTYVTITDTSGLIDGESTQLMRYATEDNYPDIPGMIGKHLGLAPTGAERLITNSGFLRRFTVSAAAIGMPLVFRPSGPRGVLLVACGEDFLGLLQPVRLSEQEETNLLAHESRWYDELPGDPDAPTSVDLTLFDRVDEDNQESEAGDGPAGPAEVDGQATALDMPPDPFSTSDDSRADPAGDGTLVDDLERALEICVRTEKGSAATLRAELGGTHKKAASLLDQLTARGFLGPYRGPNPRVVLVPADSLPEALDLLRDGLDWDISGE